MEEINEPPRSVSNLSLDDIIKEFVFWKHRVNEAYAELNTYKGALIEYARQAKSGQNTAHLETADGSQKIKVQFRKEWCVDQEEIECVRHLLAQKELPEGEDLPAEDEFRGLFKVEYKPIVRNLRMFLNTKSGDERTEIAREIIKSVGAIEVDAQPYLTVEKDKQ